MDSMQCNWFYAVYFDSTQCNRLNAVRFDLPGIVKVQTEVGIEAEAKVVVHHKDLGIVLVGLGWGDKLLPVRPGGRGVLRQRPEFKQ